MTFEWIRFIGNKSKSLSFTRFIDLNEFVYNFCQHRIRQKKNVETQETINNNEKDSACKIFWQNAENNR